MGYRYCPSCGTEYRKNIEKCSDCGTALVDEAPFRLDERPARSSALAERVVAARRLTSIFVTGRRSEAEIAHSFLTSQGIKSWIWSSGLAPWRLEAAMTEMTGVPNDFNAHRLMVEEEDAETAKALLATAALNETDDVAEPRGAGDVDAPRTAMQRLRTRWAALAFAIVLLLIILLLGSPQY